MTDRNRTHLKMSSKSAAEIMRVRLPLIDNGSFRRHRSTESLATRSELVCSRADRLERQPQEFVNGVVNSGSALFARLSGLSAQRRERAEAARCAVSRKACL